MRNSPKIKEASHKVLDKLLSLSSEELEEMLSKCEVGPLGELFEATSSFHLSKSSSVFSEEITVLSPVDNICIDWSSLTRANTIPYSSTLHLYLYKAGSESYSQNIENKEEDQWQKIAA